jgi:hypothetical protein
MANNTNYTVNYYIYNDSVLKKCLDSKSLEEVEKNGVTWKILDDNSAEVQGIGVDKKPVLKKIKACFAHLVTFLSEYKDKLNKTPNTIAVRIDNSRNRQLSLTKESERIWLYNCAKAGFLPKDTNINEVINKRLFIVNPETCSKELLYTYLCSVRNIYEEPPVVLACIDIMERFGYRFEIAMGIAEDFIRSNGNHACMPNCLNNCSFKTTFEDKRTYGLYNAVKTQIFIKNEIKRSFKDRYFIPQKKIHTGTREDKFDVLRKIKELEPPMELMKFERIKFNKQNSKEMNSVFENLVK